MSGRIAPAVSAMGQAGVAFQLFYDYDPLADGDWPSGGASAQTVSLDRLPDARVPVGAVTDALSSSG